MPNEVIKTIAKEEEESGTTYMRKVVTVTTAVEPEVVADVRMKADPVLTYTPPAPAAVDSEVVITFELRDFDGALRVLTGNVALLVDEQPIVVTFTDGVASQALTSEISTTITVTLGSPLLIDMLMEPLTVEFG